ncbi:MULTISPECIES: hypothetical protein [unclassified Microcoleus]|nr:MULTISPECIES: hypothetical protein [unclassified Microcoleus]
MFLFTDVTNIWYGALLRDFQTDVQIVGGYAPKGIGYGASLRDFRVSK